MRIGFLTYGLDRPLTGIGHYTVELACALAHYGSDHDFFLFTAGKPKGLDGVFENHQVPLLGCRLLPGLVLFGNLWLLYTGKRLQLDLIHDPTGNMPLLLSTKRRIATVHDVIPRIFPQTSTTLDWLIYQFWLPLVVKRLDSIITVSQQSRTDIIRLLKVNPKKVTVIPEAAGKLFCPLTNNEIMPTLVKHKIDFPYFLYVGSIAPRKNLSRLLKAYAKLRKWSPKWHLVVVGAPNFWKSTPVEMTISELGLKPWVHFTGYVSDVDLPALYNGADLFVFPSLYEGFGLPVLEAMACGTPVVTSNISSLPEVAGEAALLVDPLDVECITAAIQRVLADPDLASDLRERGLEHARQFSWERTARETLSVYQKVLEEL